MIDSYLLEQLLAFYRTGTLSAAAEELHISQPALSQSMKKIESMIGAPLFNRSQNKTSFNENGLLLVDYAQKVTDLQKEMIDAVRRQANYSSKLHFASIAPAPRDAVLEQAAAFRLEAVSKLLADEKQMIADLLNDKYDLAIASRIPDNRLLAAVPFFDETLYIQVPLEHSLAKYDTISFADLAGQNILILMDIGFWMDLVKTEIPSANFLYMEDNQAFTEVASAGEFPHFVTDITDLGRAAEHKKIIPIREDKAKVTFYFVFKKENRLKWDKLIERCRSASERK
ncbi:LysR family transcriptional regulator [Streptococcus chenjunshii]|uniref:LysR family transcriptional regulator n=1 Tax=Streptococcus chenjunshii TaxID=2173853 RepID=A0A372KPL0_9STRE|nr:LysR family transcriptional regulator [Streptococcus chenjunshii]AXQ78491.1 LysR family transcriptional regulator [Streptococcus chenjunshii]RFU52048.1 LysR family transcriptional regulator [Streptococcus chenjunshii]RFU54240.1 LysR family transcriptional regulator [Streptococcus chenjunshii]